MSGPALLMRKIKKNPKRTVALQTEFAFVADSLGEAPKQINCVGKVRPSCYADRLPSGCEKYPEAPRQPSIQIEGCSGDSQASFHSNKFEDENQNAKRPGQNDGLSGR